MVRAKQVPVNVADFSELNDYCDANVLGGFCDDGGITDQLIEAHGGRDSDEGMPQGVLDFMNAAQDAVDAWIKAGGVAGLFGQANKEWPEAYGTLLRQHKEALRTLDTLISKGLTDSCTHDDWLKARALWSKLR